MDGGRRTAGGGRQCGRYGVLTNFVRARALPGYDLGQCFGPAGGHRARGHFGEDAGLLDLGWVSDQCARGWPAGLLQASLLSRLLIVRWTARSLPKSLLSRLLIVR